MLGYVFGEYLDSLEENTQPSEFEVVKIWMKAYDEELNHDNFMFNEAKEKVLESVAKIITSSWSPFLGLEQKVIQSLRSLIQRSDNVKKNRER